MSFAPIPEILDELKAGRMIVLMDDEDRENEGDLVCPAEMMTPEKMNFILTYGRGTVCLALTNDLCDKLNLHPQTDSNTARLGTAFTVTIDAHPRFGVTTGVSASDRSATVRAAAADDAMPTDFLRPGHMNPLRARDGGVLVRAGQTEGSVDLARLAGLKPAAVICEVLRPEDGEAMRRLELDAFCTRHQLKMCTIADLINYRLRREQFVQRIEAVNLPTRWGTFRLFAYQSVVDPEPHLALCMGGIGEVREDGTIAEHDESVLVRVHSECLTGDVFGSTRCDCGLQLDAAMKAIAKAGKGVLLYLRQEGRGIGLKNKLHAYALQEKGFDTVEANLKLGFPADKRDYGIGSQILRHLGLKKIQLMTNNPKKIYGLDGYGLTIADQISLKIEPGPDNKVYLETKKKKMGHLL